MLLDATSPFQVRNLYCKDSIVGKRSVGCWESVEVSG